MTSPFVNFTFASDGGVLGYPIHRIKSIRAKQDDPSLAVLEIEGLKGEPVIRETALTAMNRINYLLRKYNDPKAGNIAAGGLIQ